MQNYENKLVLITGGSSGIGLSVAKILAAQGAHIWILARREEQLQAARNEIEKARKNPDQKFGTLSADVADRKEVLRVLEEFVQDVGTPDLLITSAGITYPGMFEDLPLEVFDDLMNVNYTGTVNVIKTLLPGMIQRKSGHIVIISSQAGLLGVIGYSAYGATKFALRGLADVLRIELREHHIKMSVVFPADTQTPQLEFDNAHKPPVTHALSSGNSKTYTAEEVAEAIVRNVARGKYIITPGIDSSLFYQLSNTFGLVYPIMDILVSQAWKKVRSTHSDPSQQHQT